MPQLELLASGPGTGKTAYCIELFRKEILNSPGGIDSRAYFVLPNREHAGRIQNLVLKQGIPGLFNVHILTIQELAMRFLGGARPKPGEALRRAILKGILEDPAVKWEYFDSVKDFPGFHEQLSERVREFKAAMIDAEEFAKRSQALAKDAVFRAKFRDFSMVLQRYQIELERRGMAETEDSLARLASQPPRGETASLIILDGFYHFTYAQKKMIQTLAACSERMVVTLTLPSDASARPQVFELAEETRRFLVEAGFRAAMSAEKNHRVNAKGLLHLEKTLFSAVPTRASSDGAVMRIQAETARDEVEAIASELRRLHASTEWHFSDMAVILRDVPSYEKLIEPVFAEYGVPVHMHERKKILESGLGRFLHRLAALILDGWKEIDVLPLLKTRYLEGQPGPDTVARFERAAYSRNVSEGSECWLALASEPGFEPVLTALRRLQGYQARLQDAVSVRVFRLRIWELVSGLRLEGPSDRAVGDAVKNLLVRQEPLYAGDKAAGYSASGLLAELRRGLEVGLFSLKPPDKNRVQVYNAVMALPKEYRVVFIAGLTDQAFPKSVTEDAFFKDDERRVLNGTDPRLEERWRRRAGERYFFYMAATRARDLLFISHPDRDPQGRPVLPSGFVDEVERCFDPLPRLTPKNSPASWTGRRQAERQLAEALFQPGKKDEEGLLAAAAAWKDDPRFSSVIEAGRRDGSAHLNDPKAVEAIRSQATLFSPTRLEVFMTCAFRYFAEHTLKLKPYFDDRLKLDMGTLLHEVLEDHFKTRSKEGPMEPALHACLEKRFPESPLALEPLYRRRALMRRMKRILSVFALNEKEDERGLRPAHFELEFGLTRDKKPAEWPFLELGGVKVQGKIDRIDVSASGREAMVIDYKLGTRDLRERIDKGIEVQLPLYLLAVKRLLKLEPLGAELRFLETGKKAGLKAEEIDGLLARTEENVGAAVENLKKGDIAVRSRSCEYCDFETLCRFETWKLIYAELENE